MKSFGGEVPEEMVERCLGRMKAWVKVTRSVVAAEFPDFDALLAFEALNLAKQGKLQRLHAWQCAEAEAASMEEKSVARLALLLHLDKEKLSEQLRDHRPMARRHVLKGTSNFDAWKTAVLRTQASSWGRAHHPVDQLKQVLVAYGCFGGSSSGVEQGFSKVLKNISPQSSSSGSGMMECFLTKLILDKDCMSDMEVKEMLQRAILYYNVTYYIILILFLIPILIPILIGKWGVAVALRGDPVITQSRADRHRHAKEHPSKEEG